MRWIRLRSDVKTTVPENSLCRRRTFDPSSDPHLIMNAPFRTSLLIVLGVVLALAGCDSNETREDRSRFGFNLENCTIPLERLVDGTGGRGRDAIPALTDPPLVAPENENTTYLSPDDRVIGLLIEGEPLAVPHNILWFHEIINFDGWKGETFAVTYCPLTGSSLAFDRSAVDGAEFGVSGLLLNNNLVMYDRTEEESLWPQMNRQANCGPAVGESLPMIPVVEMTWSRWKTLHPKTKVVSSQTPYAQDYRAEAYPYPDNYEDPENSQVLFSMSIDDRRPPKERVLGVPVGSKGGLAIPFGELGGDASVRVADVTVGGEEVVVFWDEEAQGAMAYRPMLEGETLSFLVESGQIVDEQTGSTWRVDGRAVAGDKAGSQLEPVSRAYVSFWFAWAAYQPETEIWNSG